MEKINIKYIIADVDQPRKLFTPERMKTLKDSITKFGMKTPISVQEIGHNQYLIEDGERRYRAAMELGLKEVPVIIGEKTSDIDRMVIQFHLQEQHEKWNSVEKAAAVAHLATELGLTLGEVVTQLGLPTRTASTYLAFASLAAKKEYQKSEISIEWAKYIISVKTLAKKLVVEQLEEDFVLSDEKNLETALVTRIKNGEITKSTDFTKIKDSIKKDPHYVQKMIDDVHMTPDAMFRETKARGVHYLRNAVQNAQYMTTNIRRFLEAGDVIPSTTQVAAIKAARDQASALLDKME